MKYFNFRAKNEENPCISVFFLFWFVKENFAIFEHFAVENCRFFFQWISLWPDFFMCKMRHGIIIFSQGGFQCLVKSSKSVTPNQPLMCEEGLCSSSFDLSHFNFLLLAMQIAPLFVTEFTVFWVGSHQRFCSAYEKVTFLTHHLLDGRQISSKNYLWFLL